MTQNAILCNILLSCPGDVEEEKEIVEEVVKEFNASFSRNLGVVAVLNYWKEYAISEMGAEPQELLNKQFINASDLVICVFKNKLGSPTLKFESGTIQEFEEAIANDKEVGLYFSDTPISMSTVDIVERQKLESFKKQIEDKKIGIYQTYQDINDFKTLITKKILNYCTSIDTNNTKKGFNSLEIQGISNNKPTKKGIKEPPFSNLKEDLIELTNSCIRKINEANEYELGEDEHKHVIITAKNNKKTSYNPLGPDRKYEYPSIVVEKIQDFCEQKNIPLQTNFFKVNSLVEKTNFNPFYSSSTDVVGDNENELKKYNSIIEVFYELVCLEEEKIFLSQFNNIKQIGVCLSNTGKSYAEDITVTLKAPSNMMYEFSNFLPPQKNIITMLTDDLEEKIGSYSSRTIDKYTSVYESNTGSIPFVNPITDDFIFNKNTSPNYETLKEKWYNSIDDICEYRADDEDDYHYITIHFSNIKQYTNVSLPSRIFVHEGLDKIEYQIVSKTFPEKFSGELLIN